MAHRTMLSSGMAILAVALTVGLREAPAQDPPPKTTQGTASSGSLRNEDIIKLVKAGIDDATIAAKVATSQTQFDTSTNALIALKQSGVSATVLKAMVVAPALPRGGPGVNLLLASGDLGMQTVIATNSKELATLRQLSERNYFEFKLVKTKAPEKVGDVQIKLTSADIKQNKYTITLIADDKTVEKKDKGINEPVQFYLSRAPQLYELVVNEIRKDDDGMIVGYLSAPKVQPPRKPENQ